MKAFFDDGTWKWDYVCLMMINSNPSLFPEHYCYEISFETKDGGYLSNDHLYCVYFNATNELSVKKGKGGLVFHVENFQDVKKVLEPLIKHYKAKPYPIYISPSSIRRKKLKKISKITS